MDYQSIETKSEPKRKPIVFDINTVTTESNKKVRQIIKFNTNGEDLISPSKQLKPTDNCIDNSEESLSKESVPMNSDRKVIRFNAKSNSETNGLNSKTDSEPKKPKTQRKLIVFDLKDDEKVKNSTTDKSLIIKDFKPVNSKCPIRLTPTTPSNDRNVTSYDDLFD